MHYATALNAFVANIHGMALIAIAKMLSKDGSCEALTSNIWDRRLLGKSEGNSSQCHEAQAGQILVHCISFVIKTFL